MKVMKTKWITSAALMPKSYYRTCGRSYSKLVKDAWKNMKDCLLGWLMFMAKQRVVENFITRLGGEMMLLKLFLKRNVINRSSGN